MNFGEALNAVKMVKKLNVQVGTVKTNLLNLLLMYLLLDLMVKLLM